MANGSGKFRMSSAIFSPGVQGKKAVDKIDSMAQLEEILTSRPSIAAAALSSWSTPQRNSKLLRSCLSCNNVDRIGTHQGIPPPTPISSRQCRSSALQRRNATGNQGKPPPAPITAMQSRSVAFIRRNAMTRSQIHLAKRRMRGISTRSLSSTRNRECIILRNQNHHQDDIIEVQRSQRMKNKVESGNFQKRSRGKSTSAIRYETTEIYEKSKNVTNGESVLRRIKNRFRTRKDSIGQEADGAREETNQSGFLRLWLSSRADLKSLVKTQRYSNTPKQMPKMKRTPNKKMAAARRLSEDSLYMGYCLRTLLRSKKFLKDFREFLVGEFSEENLDFWMECEAYKSKKIGKLKKSAEDLHQVYLTLGSMKEVNVSADVRRRVEWELFNPNRGTFDCAQEQVYNLMFTDSFPRYLDICRMLGRIP